MYAEGGAAIATDQGLSDLGFINVEGEIKNSCAQIWTLESNVYRYLAVELELPCGDVGGRAADGAGAGQDKAASSAPLLASVPAGIPLRSLMLVHSVVGLWKIMMKGGSLERIILLCWYIFVHLQRPT